MTTAVPAPPSARRFGDYELLRYFAAGGMADLYLARNPRLGEGQVVLKRVQARYLDHTRVVKMFIDEGRIARLLDHPNVVRVLDVGQHEGAWFIAMEYIHGHDLVAIARRSAEAGVKIPRAIAVGIIAQVAAGLAYAHGHTDDAGQPLRLVHCDVSPGNVVIAFSGVAKIVDFGIARATVALREEGGVAGKYNYMAPEQVRGLPFDGRADLFSLGVMLHELTVGRRLFRGRPEQVMRKVCEEPIPWPSSVLPGYPRPLERVVMRLLERDPAARYPSAAEVHAALTDYLAGHEGAWGPPEVARFLGALFAPAAGVAASAAAVGASREGEGRAAGGESAGAAGPPPDPQSVVDDLEDDLDIGRGMPQSEDHPEAGPADPGDRAGAAPRPPPPPSPTTGLQAGALPLAARGPEAREPPALAWWRSGLLWLWGVAGLALLVLLLVAVARWLGRS